MFPEAIVQRCSVKKGFLENFAKLIQKHLCQSHFLIKLQALDLQLYLKRDSSTGAKFLKALLLQNTSGGCVSCLSRDSLVLHL